MAAADWRRVWRGWLKARFGGVLKGKRLDEALDLAETFRAMTLPVAAVAASELENGEPPFHNGLSDAATAPGREEG